MCFNEHHESVKRLFAEHAAARFPDECEDLEIDGVDLEELNGTVVGCVAPFVGRSGYQAVHEDELRRCQEELDAILPQLGGYDRAYFGRLKTLVNLVLEGR
jgi:hypothetical protein